MRRLLDRSFVLQGALKAFSHLSMALPLFILLLVANADDVSAANGSCAGSGCATTVSQGGALGPCYCDNNCWLRGDCCPDVCDNCSGTHTNDVCSSGAGGVGRLAAGCGPSAYIETGISQNRIPPCGSFTSVNVGPGTRTSFQVRSGASYSFSTCSSSFDTQITGYRSTGSSYTEYFFNDDSGPVCTGTLQASATWTATFTGTLNVTVHGYNCDGWNSTSGTSAVLEYRQNNNLAFTSSSADMCSGQTRTLTASPSGGSFSGTGVSGSTFTAPASAGPVTITYSYGQCSVTQTITVNTPSVAAVSINETPGSTICVGSGSVTLSVAGGTLGTGGSWSWYTGTCGGTPAGSGTSITVTPSSTTTYFVRAEGTCNTTSCVSQVITVNTNSTAPTGITATVDTFCPGTSTVLSVQGGSLGTAASWEWYSGASCCTTPVGTGSSITVTPSSNITYHVRAEGTCNTTAAVSRGITVKTESTAPSSITSSNGTTFCSGSANTTLSVVGGSLGTAASWQWYSASCGGTPVGVGASVSVNPTATTTYFVRAEGDCNNTTCAQVTINVSVGLAIAGVNTTAVTCNGAADGSVGLTGLVTGGIPPYNYSWSPGGASTDSVTGLSAGVYSVTITDQAGCTVTNSGTIAEPTAVVISNVSSSSVDCNGSATGTISVSAAGGTNPLYYSIDSGYTYQTTPSYTGLVAGNYYVFVQDANGCTVEYPSNPVFISQPTALVAAIAGTQDANCSGVNNGSITAQATGGTSPYQYSINGGSYQPGPTFTSLPAGTFDIIVLDDNGCADTTTATINNQYTLTLTVDSTSDVTCNGDANGSFTVSGGSGTQPYEYSLNGVTYQASGTFSGLSGGTYVVQTRDAVGCTANTTLVIDEPDPLVATVDSVINVLCNGQPSGGIYVSVTGGTQGSYPGSSSVLFTPFPSNTVTGTTTGSPTFSVISGGANSGRPNANGTCCAPYNAPAYELEFQVDVTGSYTIDASWAFDGYLFLYDANYDPTVNPPAGYVDGNDDYTGLYDSQVSGTLTAGQPYTLLLTGWGSGSGAFTLDFTGPGNAGTAQIISSPGTAYQFDWSNGATTEDLLNVAAGTYTLTVTDTNGCTTTVSATVSEPLPFNVTLADSSQVSCAGFDDGELDVTATGGTPPYTFAWSNGATTEDAIDLEAGSYTLTATDANGCSNIQTFTIEEPDPIVGSVDISQPSCAGTPDGAIDLTISGGTPPYFFLWSNGAFTEDISGLAPGTYSVQIIDFNNCIAAGTFVLDSSNLLTVDAEVTNLQCYGDTTGEIDLTVTGGMPSSACPASTVTIELTFDLWPEETFWEVRDNNTNVVYASTSYGDYSGLLNQTVVETICVPFNADVTVTIFDDWADGIFAPGGYVIYSDGAVVGSGGSFGASESTSFTTVPPVYTYTWSTGDTTEDLTGLSAGTYTVTVTSPTCSEVLSVDVTSPDPIVLNPTITDVSCYGDSSGVIDLRPIGGNLIVLAGSGTPPPACYDVVVTINTDSWGDETMWELTDPSRTTVYAFDSTEALADNDQYITTICIPADVDLQFIITDTWGDGFGSGGSYEVAIDGSVVASGSGNFGDDETATFSTPNPSVAPTCNDVVVSVTTDGYGYETSWQLFDNDNNVILASAALGSLANNATSNTTVCVPFGTDLTFTIEDDWGDGIFAPGGYEVTLGGAVVASGGAFGASESTSFNSGAAPAASFDTLSFDYVWSTGDTTSVLDSLPAGSYSVTVTDANGCSVIDTFVIEQNDSLAVQGVVSNVTCNGRLNGSINTTVTGGVPFYTYLWSNGATTADLNGLAAGTYTLTVTDQAGCTLVDSFEVTQPDTLLLSFTGTDVSCFGGNDGTASVTATGGTAPYSYLWSNSSTASSLSGLTAGTYTVVVTDDNGCTVNGTYTVAEPTQVVATATLTNVSCYGGGDGEISLVLSGGVSPYDIAWSNGPSAVGTTTTVNSSLTAGTYTITITDQNGCDLVETYTITQPDSIMFSATVTDVTCYGDTTGAVDLTVTGGTTTYTFAWSNGATTEDLSNVVAGTYDLTLTDANNCTATYSVTVDQPDSLDVQSSITNVTCYGGSDGAIYLSVSGGVPPYAYAWSNGATTANNTGLAADTYTVSVTDGNGCVTTTDFDVTEPDTLVADATPVNVDCYGASTGGATLVVTGGTAPYTYLWSNFSTAQDLSGVAAGFYTVVVTDANGCSTTDTVTVSQNDPIELAAAVTDVTCFGAADGEIILTVTGGVSPYTYLWSNGATVDTLTGLAADTYDVTVTDAVGCTATGSYTVAQPDSLTVTGDVTDVTCAGSANGAIDVTVIGGTPNYTFAWSNSATTEDISGLEGGVYVLTLTDANGCTSVDSFTIVEPDTLTSTASGAGISCYGFGNGSATVTVTGGTPPYTYFWSNFHFTATIDSLEEGEYFVIVTDANGCTTLDSVTVVEPDPLMVTGAVKESGCVGESKGIVDITVTGGTAPYDYIWSPGGETTEDIDSLPAGTYSVTVTDFNGCVETYTTIVTAFPKPNADFTANLACLGQPTQFVNQSNISDGDSLTYEWDFGDGSFSTEESPSHTFETIGSINVTLYAQSSQGCLDTSIQTIFINSVPDANIYAFGDTAEICTADSVELSVEEAAGQTYFWSNGDTTSSIMVYLSGSYSITVVSAEGCASEDTIEVGIFEGASVVATPVDTTVSLGFPAQLNVTGGIAYEWSPTDGLSDPTIGNPTATPLENTTYSVTVTVSEGCFAVREMTVNVVEDYLVVPPNLFSPNGDGINDYWVIDNIENYPICEVMVFNRWGSEIFTSEGYQNDWDGTANGQPVSDGTYYFILKCADKTYKGAVTILR